MLKLPSRAGLCGLALLVASLGTSSAALAQSSRPSIVITPQTVQLPVIPQGNYLDPGPAGPPIRPDVDVGPGPNNMNYAFPPSFDNEYGGGPPGDPTVDGQWGPLNANTPSF